MDQSLEFNPIILIDHNKPWEKIIHIGTPITFNVRSIVPANDSDAMDSGAYYIRKGRIRLSYIAENGMEKVLIYMGRGMLFNEIPMIHATHSAIFTCMEKVDAVFFPKKILTTDFAKEYPDLMINMIRSISMKAVNFTYQLSGIGIFSSFINVCRTFYSMHLYNRHGNKVVPHLTQLELAAFLGIHRSSLHKAITRLKYEGVIEGYTRNELEILDLETLKDYATGKLSE